MPRPSRPLPMEFFERPRAATGSGVLHVALGQVRLTLEGLAAELEATLRARYGRFLEAAPSGAGLRVEVLADERAHFIAPPTRPELNRVLLACDGDRVRFLGHGAAGWFDTSDGRGQLVLAREGYETAERSAENYIRAAVAWQAAGRGGSLVHAASAVREGRGYLFYGESGAGKSTLAACNRTGRIVSDDLSLVLPGADGRMALVGSPFRGTYEGGDVVRGSFPLAAGFRILKAERARVEAVPRARALAELVGNLPFVAETFGQRPDLFAGVARAFRDVPLAHLHFRRDDSFWAAIADAGL